MRSPIPKGILPVPLEEQDHPGPEEASAQAGGVGPGEGLLAEAIETGVAPAGGAGAATWQNELTWQAFRTRHRMQDLPS